MVGGTEDRHKSFGRLSSFTVSIVSLRFYIIHSIMGEDNENYKKVTVEPQAFVSMLLHARQHPYQPVHGVLLGRSNHGESLTVAAAVPLCHGTPVQPWMETSLALVEAQLNDDDKIVGWYTAPRLLADTRPGPVALRMASILENSATKPTLLVLDNQAAADCVNGDTNQVPAALQAFGKDFGNQYQEKIATVVNKSASITKALQEAIETKVACHDFLDHLQGEASTTWYPNAELTKLVEKVAT